MNFFKNTPTQRENQPSPSQEFNRAPSIHTLYSEFTLTLPGLDMLGLMKSRKTKPADRRKNYQSYLLRLWFEDLNGDGVWRISLENPFSGERRGFANLKDLHEYLNEKMQEENEENQEVENEE
jgi:hypothetical protein